METRETLETALEEVERLAKVAARWPRILEVLRISEILRYKGKAAEDQPPFTPQLWAAMVLNAARHAGRAGPAPAASRHRSWRRAARGWPGR